MCGICGVFAPGRRVPDGRFVEDACSVMTHRGPDDQGGYRDGRISMGMVRLRVLGLSGGTQPARSRDGTTVAVVNGEIYNHRQLRSLLESRGRRVEGTSDIAVVPDLYEEFGPAFVERLHGMFAVALYDTRTERLVLATDRTGKKPLHLATTSTGEVVFASELAALACHPQAAREVDPIAVDQYLSYRVVPAPRTIYRGMEKIEPASVVVVDPTGTISRRRYWDFPFTAELGELPDGEVVDRIDRLMNEAVESRLESDVPLGTMLSGGLDSMLVTALTARHTDRELHSFSVGFDHPDFDESEHARRASAALGTRHHVERLSARDIENTADDVLAHVGEPYAFPSAIASWAMYRLASRHVTVVLTGDGSDEIFCGYRRYARFADLDPHADLAERYQGVLLDGVVPGLRRKLYRPDFLAELGGELPDHLVERFGRTRSGISDLDRAMHVDCRFWLPDAQLVKIDRMAMAHSVEPRSPFLDHRLADFVARIPANRKLVGGVDKKPLRATAERYLPAALVNRPKQELAVPLETWLQASMAPRIRSTLLSEQSLDRGYFDPDALRELVENFRPEHSYALWTLFMLERWHQLIEAPAAGSGRAA